MDCRNCLQVTPDKKYFVGCSPSPNLGLFVIGSLPMVESRNAIDNNSITFE